MKINDAERQVSTGDFKLRSQLIFFFLVSYTSHSPRYSGQVCSYLAGVRLTTGSLFNQESEDMLPLALRRITFSSFTNEL